LEVFEERQQHLTPSPAVNQGPSPRSASVSGGCSPAKQNGLAVATGNGMNGE